MPGDVYLGGFYPAGDIDDSGVVVDSGESTLSLVTGAASEAVADAGQSLVILETGGATGTDSGESTITLVTGGADSLADTGESPIVLVTGGADALADTGESPIVLVTGGAGEAIWIDSGTSIIALVTGTVFEATADAGTSLIILVTGGTRGSSTRRSTANLLRCGIYDAYVLTRGGLELVAMLPWSSLEWARLLNDTSMATIEGAAGADVACCRALAQVRSWRHELAIYRNGDLEWVGPIVFARAPEGMFRIEARDLSAWFDHRLVHDTIELSETDLAAIYEAVAADAMAPDDSPRITVSTQYTNIKATKRVLHTQHVIAGSVLRDLVSMGLDMTTVRREVLAGGLVMDDNIVGTMTDEHFVRPPTPVRDGTAQANRWIVRGAGGGDQGDTIYGDADDEAAARLDGLLESVESNSGIEDVTSAQSAADTRAASTGEVILVEDCELSPNAPFTLDQLIPGSLFKLNLQQTCIPVDGTFRLQSIGGKAAAGDDTDGVSAVFVPAGATA